MNEQGKQKLNTSKWIRGAFAVLALTMFSFCGVSATLASYVDEVEGTASTGIVAFDTLGVFETGHLDQTIYHGSSSEATYLVTGTNHCELDISITVIIETTGNLPLSFKVNGVSTTLEVNETDYRKYVVDMSGVLHENESEDYEIVGTLDEVSHIYNYEMDMITISFVCVQAGESV